MAVARSTVVSLVAATLLTAVTLSTFYLLRDYGPEKTINLFRAAALAGDIREIARVTVQPPTNPNVQKLEQLVIEAEKYGVPTKVQRVQRLSGEALFWIDYLLPNGPQEVRWVVDQDQSTGWMINADKTVGGQSW